MKNALCENVLSLIYSLPPSISNDTSSVGMRILNGVIVCNSYIIIFKRASRNMIFLICLFLSLFAFLINSKVFYQFQGSKYWVNYIDPFNEMVIMGIKKVGFMD